MSDVTIYGVPQSSYTWSARLALTEKGVDYELKPPGDLRSEEYKSAHHPFGKMPALEHGDVKLFETASICRYADEAFDGPSLSPSTPVGKALQDQWISVLNCYLYRHAISNYVLAYVFPKGPGGAPDMDAIKKAASVLEYDLDVLERGLEGKQWLAGDEYSIADIMMGPVIAAVANFPEGKELVGERANLGRYLGAVAQRPAFGASAPPPPPG